MTHHDHAHDAGHAHDVHPASHYYKIYFILLALLIVSIVGPELNIRVITLITAFGVAVVKAYMVAKNFMHLNVQKPFVLYLLVACVAFMVLMFGGVAPDVMKHEGTNWRNEAALAAVAAGHEAGEAAATHHGAGAHAAPAGEHAAPAGEAHPAPAGELPATPAGETPAAPAGDPHAAPAGEAPATPAETPAAPAGGGSH